MGNASRVVLVGAMSLVVGIYGVSLKSVQTTDLNASLMPVKRVQFERQAAAAVRIAANTWVGNYNIYGGYNWSSSGTALGGGTCTFDFAYNYNYGNDYVDITLKVPSNGDATPRVVTARLQNTGGSGMLQGPRKIRRGTWQVTKYFIARGY